MDGQPAGGGGKKGSSDRSVTSELAWAASVGIVRGTVGGNHGAARSVDRLASVAGDRAGVLPSMPCTSSGIEETSSSSSAARVGCVPLLVGLGSPLDRAISRAWELSEKTEEEVRRPVDTLYRRWRAEMLSESVSEWPSALCERSAVSDAALDLDAEETSAMAERADVVVGIVGAADEPTAEPSAARSITTSTPTDRPSTDTRPDRSDEDELMAGTSPTTNGP